MATVQVTAKTGNIDGQTINWNVLSIVGYAGGEIQTLELKLNKTEAMLARILLSGDEEKPTQSSRQANEAEIQTHLEGVTRTQDTEDDDDTDWTEEIQGKRSRR